MYNLPGSVDLVLLTKSVAALFWTSLLLPSCTIVQARTNAEIQSWGISASVQRPAEYHSSLKDLAMAGTWK